ncbi:hypothetical protein [Pseudomonas aeruginosa]|uniref:hypothetical protein n=1 Tax=Pseudomonas aeruginosa TaxID=287 RepID=UPI001CA56CA8|nr:hypothetical protein [Pseudomonas aeruginosa]MBW6069668.1 hypothetical protein [Pseudomonas aeruginosa]
MPNYYLNNKPSKYLKRIHLTANGTLATTVETCLEYQPVSDIHKFYPYFNFTPAELWDIFSESSSNVLIIFGKPDTSESNFAREMLNHRGWDDKIYLADRSDILEHPEFADLIRGFPNGSVIITEDVDEVVRARTGGNGVMSAIINASEGITKRNIKLVIVTSLPTLKDTDVGILMF